MPALSRPMEVDRSSSFVPVAAPALATSGPSAGSVVRAPHRLRNLIAPKTPAEVLPKAGSCHEPRAGSPPAIQLRRRRQDRPSGALPPPHARNRCQRRAYGPPDDEHQQRSHHRIGPNGTRRKFACYFATRVEVLRNREPLALNRLSLHLPPRRRCRLCPARWTAPCRSLRRSLRRTQHG